MSIRVVLRHLGLVLVMFGALLLFPLAWSLAVEDGAEVSFLAPVAVACGSGIVLWRFLPRADRSLSRREGLALVTCTWVAASLIGALPYTISGTLPRYVDAFFETMSGFTTTGSTVIPLIGGQPPSVLLWRQFTQWIGGMGIITIFVALFPALGVGAARLLEAETTGPQKEKLQTRIAHTARILWLLYVGFTVAEVALLMTGGGLQFYDALNIALATMPTGGFLHLQASMGAYVDKPFITTVVTIFMVAAGTNFALYYHSLRERSMRPMHRNPEFCLYIFVVASATLLIVVDLLRAGMMPAVRALQHAAFQVASIQTATGFATADFDTWPSLSKAVLLVLMLIGGCAGSTAGGFKVIRLLVVIKYASRHIMTAFGARIVAPVKLGGEAMPEHVVSAVMGTTCLYVLTVFGGFLLMSGLGLDGISALSAVATTMGNVGPGLGTVGPNQNFAFISDAGKLVLTGLMLVGRLEFVTVLALLHPMYWRWR
jgi:trk system potassium uptake protein TrkH